MKNRPSKIAERGRITKNHRLANKFPPMLISDKSFGNNGLFLVSRKQRYFRLKVSDGGGWDHVSISMNDLNGMPVKKYPSWDDMCFIKDLFWDKSEVVLQYHPEEKDYVNLHPYCLHLWKPQGDTIPTPPIFMV